MAELEPDFQIRVWRYAYAEGSGGGAIVLNSPQESADKKHDTLVLRQVNSDAENKVWKQEQASHLFKRASQVPGKPLMDDAHGVIVRDGHARTIPRQGEKAVTHEYCRGDRVWVERSLVPTHDIEEDGNRIPVVDLESLKIFEIPFEYISFVPQFIKKDDSGEHHAVAVGPVLNTFLGKRKTKARVYFQWPADKPDKVSYVWLNKKNKADLNEMKAFIQIEALDKKQEAFRNHWQALTKKFAGLGLLFGDEIVHGPADPLDSSSDSEGEDLALHWKTGPSAHKHRCNLNPCPAFNNPDLDLVASYIGGYRWMEHYHVQDGDVDECPRGADHKGHCILRDNRTRCAYAIDRVRHTCCKLRMNPLLPGPYGDPDDVSLPLWETTAGDDHFIDVSRNVRTRTQLEDRDEIPPEMERLRQQLLADTAAAQQSPSATDDVQMTDAFPATIRSVIAEETQAQASLSNGQHSPEGGVMMLPHTGTPSAFPLNQTFNQSFDQSFTQTDQEPSLYHFQPTEGLQFSAPFDPSDPFTSQMPDLSQASYGDNEPRA
ncbi:hypothetical protein G7Z17_g9771 [Cylindrodendrum hubeiense]|uniref:Uncharacterized protein n=1 Tax=Cylindrodendrum hubeiense TaxID=595255 RepID=A0A9P5L7U4_9HYPO|nr:hypothetical protein G7Z17_g9771 [Cylindrodendrum hubeiense]